MFAQTGGRGGGGLLLFLNSGRDAGVRILLVTNIYIYIYSRKWGGWGIIDIYEIPEDEKGWQANAHKEFR